MKKNNSQNISSTQSSLNFIQFPDDIHYTMQWNITNNTGTNVPVIQINLSLEKPAGQYWMAIGLGRSMTGADIMMVSLNSNGTAYAIDRTGIGEETPVLDSTRSGVL